MTRRKGSGPPPLPGDADSPGNAVGLDELFGPAAQFHVPLLRQLIPRVFCEYYMV